MNITDFLKEQNAYITFADANRRLYWDEATSEWVVLQFNYSGKSPKELARTPDEQLAVAVLVSPC